MSLRACGTLHQETFELGPDREGQGSTLCSGEVSSFGWERLEVDRTQEVGGQKVGWAVGMF